MERKSINEDRSRNIIQTAIKTAVTTAFIVSFSVSGLVDAAHAAGKADINALKKEYARPKSIPFPDDNKYSKARYELGKKLFFDPRLSGSNMISCASCHNPSFSWGDSLALGVGHGHKTLGRRTPTILNLAWDDLLMWDGRAESLEQQALGPIEASVEMNMAIDNLPEKLKTIEEYVPLFEAAYPGEGVTLQTVGKAIATFERTVVSSKAPFDEWLAGDEDAISDSAKRGFVLFNTKANCVECHSSWRFTDGSFHDIGLPSKDVGRGKFFPEVVTMQHAFKTPTLRNVDRRGPFMHDGSLADLMEVMDHYSEGFIKRDSLSTSMKRLDLSKDEKKDLVEFLHTLTSVDEPIPYPVLPR